VCALCFVALVGAATAAGVPGGAGEARAAVLAIADQRPYFFADPRYQALRAKRSRYVVAWDAIYKEPETLDAWLLTAQQNGIKPLIAFTSSRGSRCPRKPCLLPSVARYTRAFRAFRKRYPWVREYQPWNEINSNTQPTWHRPVTAAAYYNSVRRRCAGCTVVAGDFQDLSNLKWYVPKFLVAVRGKPRLWGFHNYGDVNHFRFWGIRVLLSMVPGKVWLTETGAIYSFKRDSGEWAFRPDARRAARATAFMFRLVRTYSRWITRAYIYQWSSKRGDRWDSGLVSIAGRTRRALRIVSLHKSQFR
jgi:hypothetical protein